LVAFFIGSEAFFSAIGAAAAGLAGAVGAAAGAEAWAKAPAAKAVAIRAAISFFMVRSFKGWSLRLCGTTGACARRLTA